MKREPQGRLELTWMGKDKSLIPYEDGKYDYAWVDVDDPRVQEVRPLEIIETLGDPVAANDNLLVVGDSGDALRSLGAIPEWSDKYLGQVKLVYIDPPFNTGQTFANYADQMEHSVWLTLMRDRIRDIKPLMSEDASIWVHLDDVEVHRMRMVLDEEFGADNFVAEIIWGKADTSRNDAKQFSTDQDYILVYSKGANWRPNKLERTAKQDSIYTAPDGDHRPWLAKPAHAPGARTHQGMVYAIQNPFNGELMYPPEGGCWRLGQSRMLEELSKWAPYDWKVIDDSEERARICGVATHAVRKNVPALMLSVPVYAARESAQERMEQPWPEVFFIANGTRLQVKGYKPEGGTTPRTIWPFSAVGSNRNSKAEVKALFPGGNTFSTPKPERLMERIVHIGSNPGDIILDCFAGSGTTAAVAHKMGRRWITVELQEDTVQNYVLPRLAKVIEGSDSGGISTTSERVPANDAELPADLTPEDAQNFTSLLNRVAKHLGNEAPTDAIKQLRNAVRTRTENIVRWSGGGGFSVARMGPSMYDVDDTDGSVYLSNAATNGPWARAVAGQLRFSLTPAHPVFVGTKGRQRLAVVDGVVDSLVLETLLGHLAADEGLVIVAKSAVEGIEEQLSAQKPGSIIRRAPYGVLQKEIIR